MIAVKNEKGEIVARAILRILWDEKAQTPVLFKERVYRRLNLDDKMLKALDKMFIERSLSLHIPLVTSADFGDSFPSYPNPIASLGSKAPFEYVDAGDGVTDGKFVINNSRIIRAD
jgi:hypothetical protein